jgi:hypothetical protein
MFQAVQWTKVPPGASGSSSESANERVPRGGAFHESGGEMPLPEQVYPWGMTPPFENAGLESTKAAAIPARAATCLPAGGHVRRAVLGQCRLCRCESRERHPIGRAADVVQP